MQTVLNPSTSYQPFPLFSEWIDHSAFHEAPLGNAIVHFEPHFAVISLFFCSPRLLIFWLTLMMCAPLFRASLNSTHSPVLQERPSRLWRHLPSQISHHGGVNWGESYGTGRLPPRPQILWQKGDFAESETLVWVFFSRWASGGWKGSLQVHLVWTS